jgi:hypothetical protein
MSWMLEQLQFANSGKNAEISLPCFLTHTVIINAGRLIPFPPRPLFLA